MAKLASIKGAPARKTKERTKLCCSCEGEGGPPMLFRLWECENGIVEVECGDCYGDLPPYYTPDAVKAMIDEAVRQALAEHGVRNDPA